MHKVGKFFHKNCLKSVEFCFFLCVESGDQILKLFGEGGSALMDEKVTAIEKQLGIYEPGNLRRRFSRPQEHQNIKVAIHSRAVAFFIVGIQLFKQGKILKIILHSALHNN